MNKIDAFNPLSASSRPAASAGSVRRGGKDPVEATAAPGSVQLSLGASSMQALHAKAAAAPEIDQGRVDAIRQALLDGRYQVDAQALAGKLMSFEQGLPK